MDFGLEKYQGQFDKLAKLLKAARLALVPVIALIVLGAYGYAFYMPARAELAMGRERVLQLQRKLSEVRAVASNEGAIKEEIAVLEQKLAVALRQLPDSKELPVLLTDVTSLGKNSGLEFKAFRPGSEITRAFYAEVPIDIEFTGEYHDIATFFDEVSRLPRIINIGELSVGVARESSTNTWLNVKGRATTFRFVDPDLAQTTGAAAPPAARRGGAH
jgi:type IV pilus assembly protein PilO